MSLNLGPRCRRSASRIASDPQITQLSDQGANSPGLLALAVGVAVAAISDDETTSRNTDLDLKWYEGGTLRKASIREWRRSTYENKLATASYWAVEVLRRWDKSIPVFAGLYDQELRTLSLVMVSCIDIFATSDADRRGIKVPDVALVCAAMLVSWPAIPSGNHYWPAIPLGN